MGKRLKEFLHKFFKIFLILILIGIAINILILAVVFINHKNKLNDERGYLTPPGELVEVNGHKMHVLVEGNNEAEQTLVFMHSSGMVDDSVALEPLFNELKDYRLAYVDRSGFGYSESSGLSRDIDTILDETRAALEAAGVPEPYILVPIGTAGLEALYWADKYPEEVTGIIGINMNYPEEYKDVTEEEYCGIFNYLLVKFSAIGGHRFVKSIYPDNSYALYTEKQMLVRKALLSRGYYTSDMYNEDLKTVDNAAKVLAAGWPEKTPMLMIYANPIMEPYINEDESVREEYEEAVADSGKPDFDYVAAYNAERIEYVSKYSNVAVEEMSGPSRLYTYNPEKLAKLMKEYVNAEMLQ